MDSLKIAKKCEEILDDKKGIDIKLIKPAKDNVLADYIVIATGTSSTHVKALADEVEVKLKELGVFPHHIEGHRSNTWILIDYTDVIVHVFSEEARTYYNIYGESVDKCSFKEEM